MSTANSFDRAAKRVDELLALERQVWLCGAGISVCSGIPLMYPLTERVRNILKAPHGIVEEDTSRTSSLLQTLCDQLPNDCHIEHHLSQIGDLIALASRKSVKTVTYASETFSKEELVDAHRHIQCAIRHTVEYGYVKGAGGAAEKIGTANDPVTTHVHHEAFVHAIFHERRAGLDRRPPVRFFTTNYDTLLEDSLARCRIPFTDGFVGGATAFWDPRHLEERLRVFEGRHSAMIFKLHGSIDWVFTEEDVVMRVRTSAVVPLANDVNKRLLIYPQATKYLATQRDPFARLFSDFRSALSRREPTVFVVCGYSFGDEHINEEIDHALRQSGNSVTLIACCRQEKDDHGQLIENEGLPREIVRWLSAGGGWKDRIVVLGSDGYYHGSLSNQIDKADLPTDLNWWSFSGLTRFLKHGPEIYA